jgi:coenzyme F420-0:L-glutamate ligase/coenzyme F420-1:gamma-L-glutamate ligase
MHVIRCDSTLVLRALCGLPRVVPGDDLVALIGAALSREPLSLLPGDVLVVASKVVSRAEGRFVDLARVVVSAEARALAETVEKDPRLVELILQESTNISRQAKDVLIVRHRLGFVSANAGIDLSNAAPGDVPGEYALLLPRDPDASAATLCEQIRQRWGVDVGVVISDSHGRPFRLGSVGIAVGVSGLPALIDQRGRVDLDGRPLMHTLTALADQLASAADLVLGQADEGRAVVVVRGLSFEAGEGGAAALIRPRDQDLYA